MSDLQSVSYAVLQGPINFAGKNFDTKLDARKYPGLNLQWCEGTKRLHLTWNNETMEIPNPNVAGFQFGETKDRKYVQMAHPMVLGIGGAQVETPMSHVHAGQGHGKTGKAK